MGTVSKALNGRGQLREQTRERVRAAAEQLGFEPNTVARSLLAGRTYTVAEMVAALERVAGAAVVRRIRWEPDATTRKIVAGWPTRFAPKRALTLGFTADADLDAILRGFLEDDIERPAA